MSECTSNEILIQKKKYLISLMLKELIAALLCLATFTAVYLLIVPEVTFARNTYCGCAEHIHTDECCETETVLICPLRENENHIHAKSCYMTKKKLICTVEEHAHTEVCSVGANQVNAAAGSGKCDTEGKNGIVTEASVKDSFFILLISAVPILLILYVRINIRRRITENQKQSFIKLCRELSLDRA